MRRSENEPRNSRRLQSDVDVRAISSWRSAACSQSRVCAHWRHSRIPRGRCRPAVWVCLVILGMVLRLFPCLRYQNKGGFQLLCPSGYMWLFPQILMRGYGIQFIYFEISGEKIRPIHGWEIQSSFRFTKDGSTGVRLRCI